MSGTGQSYGASPLPRTPLVIAFAAADSVATASSISSVSSNSRIRSPAGSLHRVLIHGHVLGAGNDGQIDVVETHGFTYGIPRDVPDRDDRTASRGRERRQPAAGSAVARRERRHVPEPRRSGGSGRTAATSRADPIERGVSLLFWHDQQSRACCECGDEGGLFDPSPPADNNASRPSTGQTRGPARSLR